VLSDICSRIATKVPPVIMSSVVAYPADVAALPRLFTHGVYAVESDPERRPYSATATAP
jgi:hypothetical protein